MARRSLVLVSLALIACGSCKKARPNNPSPTVPADRVEVTPASFTIEVEQTIQLSARALDMNGNVLSKTVTWKSDNEAFATVSPSGLVTGVGAGMTRISATVDGKTGISEVTVVPKNDNPVATVEVSPANVSIAVAETTQLTAIARDASGGIITNRPVTWMTDTPAVASVSNTGLVMGLTAGNARITATIEGISGSATIEVRQIDYQDGDVNIRPAMRHQTITGWEGTAQIGQLGCNSYNTYRASLIDRLVNELGINRVRLEIRSGSEAPSDWFTDWINGDPNWRSRWYNPVNDNSDPNTVNPSGFWFTELDHQVDHVITPMQQALAARGEQLYVLLCLVDFSSNPDSLHRQQPAEYGELMAAAFDHLQSRYGWVPDGIEIILEPDNGNNGNVPWTAQQVANAIAAVGERMAAEGYSPEIVAPSTVNMWNSLSIMDAIQQNQAALSYLDELSYHRYVGADIQAAQAIAQRAAQLNIKTAMLEHIDANIDELWEDLTVANNSAWQQFALAFCDSSGGAAHYYEINDSNGSFYLRPESRPFVQIFRHVRRNAVRFGTEVRNGALRAMAFQNANGKWVVVVRTQGPATFTVGHLPPGTYGVDYTTDAELIATKPDITIEAGETASLSIPAAGLITIFGR